MIFFIFTFRVYGYFLRNAMSVYSALQVIVLLVVLAISFGLSADYLKVMPSLGSCM